MSHTINRLSPEMVEDFRTLVGLAKHDALGIVHTELDGKPVAVVMTTNDTDAEAGVMFPLAILVDEDLLSRLANPFDEDNENDGKLFPTEPFPPNYSGE